MFRYTCLHAFRERDREREMNEHVYVPATAEWVNFQGKSIGFITQSHRLTFPPVDK